MGSQKPVRVSKWDLLALKAQLIDPKYTLEVSGFRDAANRSPHYTLQGCRSLEDLWVEEYKTLQRRLIGKLFTCRQGELFFLAVKKLYTQGD